MLSTCLTLPVRSTGSGHNLMRTYLGVGQLSGTYFQLSTPKISIDWTGPSTCQFGYTIVHYSLQINHGQKIHFIFKTQL